MLECTENEKFEFSLGVC